ncbi:mCG148276 [Mus musculus]|nr:mCG148276 [Mus musculus]
MPSIRLPCRYFCCERTWETLHSATFCCENTLSRQHWLENNLAIKPCPVLKMVASL